MNAQARRWLQHSWFTGLVLGAILSRALVPVGFMPSAHGMMLCTGYGAVPVIAGAPALDPSGTHPAPAHDGFGSGLCPFAAAAATVAIAHEPAPVALGENSTPLVVVPESPIHEDGTLTLSPLPRGPPNAA